MIQSILFIGGGGHAKVLIDLIKMTGQFDIKGILDPGIEAGSRISGIPVIGEDDLLTELFENGMRNACISIGSIRSNEKRKILYEKARKVGFSVPSLLHPKAVVSENTKISKGVQVMAGVVIQPDCSIMENSIINTGAIIDHDCSIGKHVHVCPGVVMSGGVVIGDKSFIGAGSTIIQGIRIGKNATIAAGSVVVRDVPDRATVKGVPAE